MKILITEFRQESNSLSPFTSDLDYWKSGWTLSPEDVPGRLRDEACAVRGMIEVLEEHPQRPEVIYGPAYYAQSGGTAEQAVMERYFDELGPLLRSSGPFDGVFISFHGALQTTEFDDAEAEVVRRIRDVVGEECVVACSMDLHGYVSAESTRTMDIICAYHTYPHVDFVETGRRAARLGLAAISDRRPPVMAACAVPMMVSASAYNTLEGPFRDLIEQGQRLVADGELLDFSIFQMQPWLDVPDPHSTVLAIGRVEEKALFYAKELAQRLYDSRHEFIPDLVPVDEVLRRAEDPEARKPVILVDSADSPNAGAGADSMAVVDRFLNGGHRVRMATVVQDPAAVAQAFEAGVGASRSFRLGGGLDASAVTVELDASVCSLHEGTVQNAGVGSAGSVSRLGRTAVLSSRRDGARVDVIVCEHLVSPGDPQVYRGFGVEPLFYDLVVVKANTSFRALYRDIAGEVYDADTPGAAAPNVRDLPFKRLSRTVFPWVDRAFEPVSHLGRR